MFLAWMVIKVESSKQTLTKDEKILLTVTEFLNYGCRISDHKLSTITNISSSSIGRYLTSNRTRELIGDDNFAFIKLQRTKNKLIGRQKGGQASSRKKRAE